MASAFLATLAMTGPASAATLSEVSTADGTQVRYIAGPGELNFVFPSIWDNKISLQEGINSGVTPVTTITPCEAPPYVPATSPHFDCPATGVTSLYIDLGDQNDQITFGGMGPLGLPVTLKTGDGNDDIYSADKFPDTIDCGPGYDHIRPDPEDTLSNCERVELPEGSSGSRADGRAIGISLDHGALFTNDPQVTVTAYGPDAANAMLLSNDGGFAAASPFSPLGPVADFTWTLAQSGGERLPKIVYARFTGGGVDSSRTFTDDIILDQTPPVIGKVKMHAHILRVLAKDSTSGVAAARYRFAGGEKSAFTKFTAVTRIGGRTPRAVQVRDGAMNVSRWRPVVSRGPAGRAATRRVASGARSDTRPGP